MQERVLAAALLELVGSMLDPRALNATMLRRVKHWKQKIGEDIYEHKQSE